jgi:quinoprotein dehydrogenase-associated probable ABC transporter substrate-binding protein/PQQ-dependent catabolism-associated CXXCW motif protein
VTPGPLRRLLLAAGLLLPAAPAALAQTPPGELVDRSALRVCADPNNLPFSNQAGEGFENEIAELMAERLGLPLEYTWFPQSIGFVRNTLRERRCDLIMGVVAADELVQNTNPYYRSAYVMVVREADRDRFPSLDAPAVALARLGVVAGTPPADLLARKGLSARIRPYQLVVDTRVDQPAREMVEDVVEGEIDVALLWGPIAGYWIAKGKLPLAAVPLPGDPRTNLRMDYRISMGMRPNEPDWKHAVNRLISELQPRIDKVLVEYGVPLLDEQGRLVGTTAPVGAAATSTRPTVEEPAGYRTDRYRAPVPATLAGATVLDAGSLKALIEAERPVVVDVMPKTRKPEGRDASQLWIEPKREGVPGAVWLPNVGYGELASDFRAYFETELAGLTGGDKAKPVVFYCDANCWMSWNAAKRAREEFGYTRVYWFPEGVQGWKSARLEPAAPREIPMPAFAQQQ